MARRNRQSRTTTGDTAAPPSPVPPASAVEEPAAQASELPAPPAKRPSDAQLRKEIEADMAALRDEKLLRRLSPAERARLGHNPAGRLEKVYGGTPTVAQAKGKGCTQTASKGFFCKGTPGVSKGVTCCLVLKL